MPSSRKESPVRRPRGFRTNGDLCSGLGRARATRCCSTRVKPWFEALERPTVCVTHGGVIRILFRLVEDMPAEEAAAMDVTQDRVLRLKDSRLEWL